jgi:hypothetical protein
MRRFTVKRDDTVVAAVRAERERRAAAKKTIDDAIFNATPQVRPAHDAD